MKAHADPADIVAALPVSTKPRRWLAATETSVGTEVEVVTAMLVVVEILVLLAGVASRYIFQTPLELAVVPRDIAAF